MSDKRNSKNWFMRHKVLSVIGVLIVLGIIGSAANSGTTTTNSNNSSSSNSESAKTAKLNEVASDGKFEFTVASVKCGIPSVSDSSGYVSQTAQGQYCIMKVAVKNAGDSQQIFVTSDQKLLNANGQQYSPDITATLYNGNNTDTFASQINPGNTVSGEIVFDIPKDQTPITAELHESAFSSGVKVILQ